MELIAVIGIVGLLAAVLIPSLGAAKISAKRAKTKVLFAQWTAAMELFRREYGFYPAIDDGTGKLNAQLLAGALTGRRLDGADASTPQLAGNSRLIPFLEIGAEDMNTARTALVDAFENSEFGVLWDRDGDGRITSADGTWASVHAKDGGLGFKPAGSDGDLAAGIDARVIFYSAGRGETAADLVLSWK